VLSFLFVFCVVGIRACPLAQKKIPAPGSTGGGVKLAVTPEGVEKRGPGNPDPTGENLAGLDHKRHSLFLIVRISSLLLLCSMLIG
jgi:hypothetical protein